MSRLSIALLWGACALITIAIVAQPLVWIVSGFVVDDALYYLRVPLNIVAGHGVTYDRATFTNGFHPLWGLTLLPLAALSHPDELVMLRISLVLGGVICLGCVWCINEIGQRLNWSVFGRVTAMVAFFFPRFDLWMSLMESGLSAFMLLATILCILKYNLFDTEKRPHQVLLGALLALTFLVRLDHIFIILSLSLGVLVTPLIRGRTRQALTASLITGATALVIVAPYLLLNQLFFSSIVPVSGRKKHVMVASFGAFVDSIVMPLRLVAAKLSVPVFVVVFGVIVFMLFSGWAVYFVAKNRRERPTFLYRNVMPFFAAGVVLRLVYLRIFVAAEAAKVSWYWVPEYILACLLIGYLADVGRAVVPSAIRHHIAVRFAAVVLLLLALVMGGRYIVDDSDKWRPEHMITIDLAQWAKANLPPDRHYAMYDSGAFSYFSGLKTISLNGLIGDRWMMERARAGDFEAIMSRYNVLYLVAWTHPKKMKAIPPQALIKCSDRAHRHTYRKGKQLCIIDWRIYNPRSLR